LDIEQLSVKLLMYGKTIDVTVLSCGDEILVEFNKKYRE
jgi:hypothetical protein